MQEINLSLKDMRKVNQAIHEDTKFLAKLNIMDYSILLGIESKVFVNTENIDYVAGRKATVR